MRRLSHSQINIWHSCKQQWYLNYIKKIHVPQDMKYANAGTVLHDTLEQYYTHKYDIDKVKEIFEALWKKYSLELTDLDSKKDTYWLMVLRGIKLNLPLTEFEEVINIPGFYARLDGSNFKEGLITDWKSSTRGDWNESEYLNQLRQYSWAYFKKFGKLPVKATTYYLKYDGDKGRIDYVPTEHDIKLVQSEIDYVHKEIDEAIEKNDFPKCCEDGSKCPKFCPYGEICFGKNKLTFKLRIAGNYIQIMNKISPKLVTVLKNKFSYMVQGATFIQQNSNWSGRMELYNERTQTVRVGFRDKLLEVLKLYAEKNGKIFDYDIIDERDIVGGIYHNFPDGIGLTLRPYQEEAVEHFIRNKQGIICVATGGGKTEISFEIIRQLKRKTLFVVNRNELLGQTVERLERAFGFEIGVIQGQNNTWRCPIVVASIQTLAKDIKKYREFFSEVEFVICDECHIIASKSFRKLFNALPSAEYRLGLSATPKRDDGDDMLIEEGVGQIVYTKTAKELQDMGYIMRPTIKFYQSKLMDGSSNYHEEYVSNIVENQYRNTICKNIIDENKGKKVLILCKTVEHGRILNDMLEGSFHLHGSVNAKIRKEAFAKFKEGGLDILISTLSIAQQGLDIKDLDIIINCSANKGDIASIQVIGRVLRIAFGKKEAVYIDFIDKGHHTQGHSVKRIKAFQNEGYDIEVIQ